jgi:hypothetical protein
MPVEITWSADGVEVIYACEQNWVDTRQGRREYLRGEAR